MNNNNLIKAIDLALEEADNFVLQYYDGHHAPMKNTVKALTILRKEIQDNPENINRRVLRAMCDISGLSVKAYEDTPLGSAISKISGLLYDGIPIYRHLAPL